MPLKIQEPSSNHVVAIETNKREATRLRVLDRIREDEYRIIKFYVKEMRDDLNEIDFHTMERLLALAVFRSIDVEERKYMILDMVDLFYPYA